MTTSITNAIDVEAAQASWTALFEAQAAAKAAAADLAQLTAADASYDNDLASGRSVSLKALQESPARIRLATGQVTYTEAQTRAAIHGLRNVDVRLAESVAKVAADLMFKLGGSVILDNGTGTALGELPCLVISQSYPTGEDRLKGLLTSDGNAVRTPAWPTGASNNPYASAPKSPVTLTYHRSEVFAPLSASRLERAARAAGITLTDGFGGLLLDDEVQTRRGDEVEVDTLTLHVELAEEVPVLAGGFWTRAAEDWLRPLAGDVANFAGNRNHEGLAVKVGAPAVRATPNGERLVQIRVGISVPVNSPPAEILAFLHKRLAVKGQAVPGLGRCTRIDLTDDLSEVGSARIEVRAEFLSRAPVAAPAAEVEDDEDDEDDEV